MKIDTQRAKQRLEEYLQTNTKIYPIEIARILGIEVVRAEKLFRKYRTITHDNQLPSVNAINFFNLYFAGQLSLKNPKNNLRTLKLN